ncbi:MAG TPA: hypothetical protein VHP83_25975 [Aggregatilineaceae bacterium]|nr:hypothetical protein [Aggregatilineaceae bacterium]
MASKTVRRIIFALLTVILGCGGLALLFYFWLNYQSFRADFVAARAQNRVEQIYTRTRAAAPRGSTLIREAKPQSGTYAWGLSDGASRNACVRSQQIYTLTADLNAVVAAYQTTFRQWGWTALPNSTSIIRLLFNPPGDKNLWVGLCAPAPDQYVIFFDFDESAGCEGTRPECLAYRYCQ